MVIVAVARNSHELPLWKQCSLWFCMICERSGERERNIASDGDGKKPINYLITFECVGHSRTLHRKRYWSFERETFSFTHSIATETETIENDLFKKVFFLAVMNKIVISGTYLLKSKLLWNRFVFSKQEQF